MLKSQKRFGFWVLRLFRDWGLEFRDLSVLFTLPEILCTINAQRRGGGMADAMDSKSIDRKVMRVQVPPSAQYIGACASQTHLRTPLFLL